MENDGYEITWETGTPVLLHVAAAVVALAGMGVAGYLTWAHYADQAVICVAGGGCEKVQSSDYAEILGVPVAVLGLAAYATILGLIAWDAPIARLSAASLALFGVLRGVTVGDNSVLGTYAVVARDVPPNVVAAGVPAKVLRRRDAPKRMRWE